VDLEAYVFSQPYAGWLLHGMVMTWAIGVGSCALAVLFALLLLPLRLSSRPGLAWMARGWVCLFRNLPPVPLLLFLTFALPGLMREGLGIILPRNTEFGLLLLGLGLNASAYLIEILRSGLNAVPRSQFEVALALGMSPWACRVRVLYPQAISLVMSALVGRLIHTVKNSAVAMVLPLPVDRMEVLGQAARIAGQTFAWAEPLLAAALTHLCIATLLSAVLGRWARRQQAWMGRGR
jgi:His/Glu/Gln/Arg/opine family amino acid ABC transporter permease subunit